MYVHIHVHALGQYLKVTAVGGHELFLGLLPFLSIEQHSSQTLIEISVVECKVVPR